MWGCCAFSDGGGRGVCQTWWGAVAVAVTYSLGGTSRASRSVCPPVMVTRAGQPSEWQPPEAGPHTFTQNLPRESQ